MKFIIQGGRPLEGEITLAGAKNAVTKMMVASLLTSEECVLENIPLIGDLNITVELCELLGSQIKINGHILKIKTPEIKTIEVLSLSRRNRIPILTLGPLLARKREAKVPILGGDKLGPRPVDIHLESLRMLGAEVSEGNGFYEAKAKNGLHGARIRFRYPSVGATENTILAAVLAEGRTVIEGAAVEPEITELIKMLQKMGAIIELGADRRVYIDGVQVLKGVRHRLLSDRNEAVSFACLAIATGGNVLIKDAVQEHLITFLNTIRRLGADYEVTKEGIKFWRTGNLRAIQVETDTHPGFVTDWQQPLAVLLTQADGESAIHETVYEDRFGYTKDLNSMGSDIRVSKECLGELACRFQDKGFEHSAIIIGPTKLKAAKLRVPDLRAGMAHVISACIAEGESEIDNVEEIDRGYERIDERLRQLGVKIQRE
jgi:UDP-N-acetylglucosamine 1-carboxyvinyltransferase